MNDVTKPAVATGSLPFNAVVNDPAAGVPAAFRFRFSNPADVDNVVAFYGAHDHKNYAYRVDLTPDCVRRGDMFLIETDQRMLVGASGAFQKQDPDMPEQHWTEIGQTHFPKAPGGDRSKSALGYGLYQIMISSQAVLAYLKEENLRFVYAEVDDDPAAEKVVQMLHQDMTWVKFMPRGKLEELQIAELPADKTPEALGYGFIYLRLDQEAVAQNAKLVLDAIEKGYVERKGKRIPLDLSEFSLANEYLPHLKALASMYDHGIPAPGYMSQDLEQLRAAKAPQFSAAPGTNVPKLGYGTN